MEFIDKIVGWAVALSPVVGGIWVYFATRKSKGNKEADNQDQPAVIQGQPVQIAHPDYTDDYIQFLRKDHAELNSEVIDLRVRIGKANTLLHQNGLPPQ